MDNVRNVNLDLMRFIGVIIIMIAHANPPEWLFQLRNFGTPLLIVASALTYSVIYAEKSLAITRFYIKRLERLVFPAWIFLTFFFLFFFAWAGFFREEYPFSFKDIIFTYGFYGGIGFVWILKVYIFLALLTPLALKVKNSNLSDPAYFFSLCMLYVLYEFGLSFIRPQIPNQYSNVFDNLIFVLIPYVILYLYGMRLGRLHNKTVIYIVLASFFVFLICLFYRYCEFGRFVSTQDYKYPPTVYYLSYAFFSLNIVWLLCKELPEFSPRGRRVILWLSSKSLWIYLWHIMAFYLWEFTLGEKDGMSWFLCKLFFILVFSTAFTAMQAIMVEKLVSEKSHLGRKIISLLS